MELKEERFVNWSEAKKILESREKDSELGYEQKNALEHLKKFCKLSEKKASELSDELGKIGALKNRQVAMIVSMLPRNQEELRVLLANEVVRVTEDDRKKILSAVKKCT